jgi:rhodanese-related sulfurtransferase
MWAAVRAVTAAHVADLEHLAAAYLGIRDGVEEITRDELAQRLRAGNVIVLDVRPTEEFEAGHVRGARSVPIGELRRHLRTLPYDAEIVAYCRGPYCVFANEAVVALRKRGYRARRLVDGFPEWRRAGLAVAAGTEP